MVVVSSSSPVRRLTDSRWFYYHCTCPHPHLSLSLSLSLCLSILLLPAEKTRFVNDNNPRIRRPNSINTASAKDAAPSANTGDAPVVSPRKIKNARVSFARLGLKRFVRLRAVVVVGSSMLVMVIEIVEYHCGDSWSFWGEQLADRQK